MESINFWDMHGIWFIIFMCFFPRLTMLIGTAVASTFGGFLFWIGWLFAPRITVAIIGTTIYWDTNPVLCVFAWLWALSGESTEKSQIVQRTFGNER